MSFSTTGIEFLFSAASISRPAVTVCSEQVPLAGSLWKESGFDQVSSNPEIVQEVRNGVDRLQDHFKIVHQKGMH